MAIAGQRCICTGTRSSELGRPHQQHSHPHLGSRTATHALLFEAGSARRQRCKGLARLVASATGHHGSSGEPGDAVPLVEPSAVVAPSSANHEANAPSTSYSNSNLHQPQPRSRSQQSAGRRNSSPVFKYAQLGHSHFGRGAPPLCCGKFGDTEVFYLRDTSQQLLGNVYAGLLGVGEWLLSFSGGGRGSGGRGGYRGRGGGGGGGGMRGGGRNWRGAELGLFGVCLLFVLNSRRFQKQVLKQLSRGQSGSKQHHQDKEQKDKMGKGGKGMSADQRW